MLAIAYLPNSNGTKHNANRNTSNLFDDEYKEYRVLLPLLNEELFTVVRISEADNLRSGFLVSQKRIRR